MRNRNIKKQVWLNREEAGLLKKKAKKTGLNESELLRNLIVGFEPREKPGEEFYQAIKELRSMSNNINQIARESHNKDKKFIDELAYKKEADKINRFIIEIKKEFLLPKEAE